MVFRHEGAHRGGQQNQGHSFGGATAANVADATMLPDLLHRDETWLWGDQAYNGQKEVIRKHAPKAQDFTNRRYRYKDRIDDVQRTRTAPSRSTCKKVEHAFGVITRTRAIFQAGRCASGDRAACRMEA